MTDPHASVAADQFMAHRRLMWSIAYRMLGSATEAEDILQETYLRYHTTPAETIRSPKAFLSTIVTRLCLNRLTSARARRELYVGPWLPEPVLTDFDDESAPASVGASPCFLIEQRESISLAFVFLLEHLTPAERAAFLLREVFEYEYAEIGQILDKTESACRQLFSRAKKRVSDLRPRFMATPEQHRILLARFMAAVSTGQLEAVMALLSDDVSLWADGGGKVPGAALRSIHGQVPVAKFVLASARFLPPGFETRVAEINGRPAAILALKGNPVLVIDVGVDNSRIRQIRVVGNPDKLARVSGNSMPVAFA